MSHYLLININNKLSESNKKTITILSYYKDILCLKIKRLYRSVKIVGSNIT